MNNDTSNETQPNSKINRRIHLLSFILLLSVIGLFNAIFSNREIESLNSSSDISTKNITEDGSQQEIFSTIDNSTLSSSSFWPGMVSRLCPNMVPASDLGPKLFELARKELGGHASCPEGSSEDYMSNQFYKWWWGPDSYRTKSGKIISYIQIWKCANDEIRRFFGSQPLVMNKTETKIEILNGEKVDCMVTAIRDPISHFLSAYNEVEFRINKFRSWRMGVAQRWPFGQQPIGDARFKQFLADVLSCPFERQYPGIYKGAQRYPSILEIHHMHSMSSTLYNLAAKAKVNASNELKYLSTLNGLADTWGPFVAESCPNVFSESTSTILKNSKVGANRHESSLDTLGTYRAAKNVWNQGSAYSRALCVLHIIDYACWTDLPQGVPDFCMDLYSKYDEEGLV